MNQFEYSNGKAQGQTVGHNTKYCLKPSNFCVSQA